MQSAVRDHRAGRLDEAETAYRRLLALNPDSAGAHMNLTLLLKQKGRLDEAAKHLQQTIRLKPDAALAHFQLGHLRSHVSSAGEIDAMKSLFQRSSITLEDRVHLAFGLGSALEKNGAYGEAFDYWLEGHRLRKRTNPNAFDLVSYEKHFSDLKSTFDAQVLERHKTAGAVSELPIFVIGMPRSGTTLTEQILASHPSIQGAGELSYLEDVVRRASSLTGKTLDHEP